MEKNRDSHDEDMEGKRFTVKFCDGALGSFKEASGRISPAGKRVKAIAKIQVLLQRIADGEKLAHGEIVPEGNLPNGKKFKALKKIPIRCYFWYSDKHRGIIFVSHFIYKDFDNLDKRDIKKVEKNWRLMEK